VQPRHDDAFGTDDLERGMRAGRASHFAAIAGIVVLMLVTINSGGLARWTQSLPSTPLNLKLAEIAADWHSAMLRVGPAALYEQLRERKD